ncbi:MAG: lysostaphin resistance A-like protein [Phycisphaerae bacterium]
MLALAAQLVQSIDAIVLIGGACGALAYTIRLLLSPRRRNPLAGVAAPSVGPGPVEILAVLFGYFLLVPTLVQALRPENVQMPGSHGWHLAQSGDASAKLLLSFVMIYLLFAPRAGDARRDAPPTPRWWRGVGLGFVGVLLMAPVCLLQLQMTELVWRRFQPELAPPVHAVLAALRDSQWGDWGRAQLFVIAVVVAPLAEELFFRGMVLSWVWSATRRAWLAIVVSGVAFGFMHFTQPQDVLPLATFGVLLGYLRIRYGSLSACVLAHAFFNGRTMCIALLAPELLERP